MGALGGDDAVGALGGPVLTILFSDVVGSTELYATHGDVAARALIAIHDDLARKAVDTYGGRFVKGLGDGAMAVFASPRAALAAAVALQEALAANRRGNPSVSLEVRIGLNSGEVLEESDGDVHGAAVSLAARVAAHATAGQVLTTDIVARLAGTVPGLELAALGSVMLKGFDDPIELRDVRWDAASAADVIEAPRPPTAAPRRVDRTELFGRSRELEDLDGWMADAIAGNGRLVLVQGEPGIGKTRLAEELLERALAAGVAVAWGRCAEDEGAPPLWPWRQVLNALDVEVADLVDVGVTEAERRFLAFERVVDHVRETTRPRAVVLVFDDLHWADHASLLLLLHLLRAVPMPRALVIGTFRATEPGSLLPVIADLSRTRGAQRIELAGLGEGDVHRHLTVVSGRDVTEAVAREVRDATAGNPFFVGELARALRDGTWTGAIPSTVRDVTRQRVQRLTGECGELLKAASVVGRDFATAAVAVVTGIGVEQSMALLDEATLAGLVEPGRVDGEHRFAHALVRDAIESDIPSAGRIALHVSAARAIEALYAGQLEPHLSELARHWAVAASAGHGAVAAAWAERAGDAAVRALAYEEAARLYAAALDLSGATLSPLDRCRVHLSLARARYLVGDLGACADASFAAADIARAAGRADLLAEAALVLEAIGHHDLNDRVHALCVEALESLADEDGHDALRARLLAQQSHLSLFLGDHGRVDGLSQQSLELARRSGDDTALVAALRARQEALSGPDGRDERVQLAELMLAAGERLHSPSVSMWGHLWRTDVLLEHGQLSRARSEVDRAAAQVDRIGGPMPRWQLARYRAAIAQGQGRVDEAHTAGLEAFQIMEPIDAEGAHRGYLALLIAVGHHARLRDDQVDRFRGIGAAQGPFAAILAVSPALALLDAGCPDEARALFTRAGSPSDWALPPFLRITTLALGLLVAARLGDRDRAAALHAMLSPYRGLHTVTGAGKFNYFGPVELPLGVAAVSLGSLDEAVADLEVAIERSSEAGAPGFVIESSCELADALAQRGAPGDRRRAIELLARARPDAESLALDLLADRVGELAASIDQMQPTAASPLSPREQDVAALVAGGGTNREIADALFISERTAQNHVQHILTKLGFSTRSQIAAWVAERR